MADLKEPDDEHYQANGLHDLGVVFQQCLSTTFLVKV